MHSVTTRTTLQILHIDDDPQFLQVLSTAIDARRPQWQVEGQVADRRWLDRWTGMVGDQVSDYDLIIIDYMLDDRHADELIKVLRSTYDNCPPITVVSGTLTPERAEACTRVGAASCHAKPEGPDDIERLLDAIEDLANFSSKSWHPPEQR